MSKLGKGDNPAVYGAEAVPDEKEKIDIPPKKYAIGVSPLDVENNSIKLTKIEKYSFKEIDGEIYRIGENGIEYPPISREEYEKIMKARNKNNQKEEDDRNI